MAIASFALSLLLQSFFARPAEVVGLGLLARRFGIDRQMDGCSAGSGQDLFSRAQELTGLAEQCFEMYTIWLAVKADQYLHL